MDRALSDPSLGRGWVFESAGQSVGYLVVSLSYSLEYGGRDVFVDELFLIPEYRGRGFGSAALSAAENFCRDVGVRALHLEVETDKTGAQALYRRWGFANHRRFLMTKLL